MILNTNYIIAIEAAIEAGISIMSVYGSNDYKIELKADESPVTIADRKSSAVIAQFLNKTLYPVIDEEHCCPDYGTRKTWDKMWLVDPMDGTKEFISGNGEFTVNIALIDKGKPEFGVIYAPVTGMLYWGGEATGSYKTANITSWPGAGFIQSSSEVLQPEHHKSSRLRVAASRSHPDEQTRNFIEKLKVYSGEMEFVTKGSSLKLCMIAEGLSDIYPRFGRTMEWDTAAGHAIVSGTGGILLQAETNKELRYNKEDLANPSFIALSGIQYKKGLLYF